MSAILDQNSDTSPSRNPFTLQALLNSYRDAARTERDKGTYFERLSVAFLCHDPVQVEQYEDVKPYSAWAVDHGWDGRDTGIDLVAKLKDERRLCGHSVQIL